MATKDKQSLLNLPLLECCYYVAFFTFCIWQGLENTEFVSAFSASLPSILKVLQVVCACFLLLKFLFQRYKLSRILAMVAIAVVLFLSSRQCGNSMLLYGFLFIVAAEGVSVKRLAKVALVTSGLMLVITSACALLGAIDNLVSYRGETVRYAMGFDHPNRFGMTLVQIAVAWLIIRFPKFGIGDIFLLGVSLVLIVGVADSRTTAISLLLVVMLMRLGWASYTKSLGRHFAIGALVVISALIGLSIYCMLSYDSSNSLMAALNSLLSERLSYAHSHYLANPPSLFGTDFSMSETVYYQGTIFETKMIVDNAYARLVILFGYLPAVVFIAATLLVLFDRARTGKIDLAYICFVMFAVMGFSEATLLNFSVDFALVVFAPLLGCDYLDDMPKVNNEVEACSSANSSLGYANGLIGDIDGTR